MRIFIFIAVLFYALVPHISAAEDKKWSAGETTLLNGVSLYLQNLDGVKGRFIQINPQGTTQEGQFLYKQPALLRFQYDAPHNMSIVVKDDTLYVQEKAGAKPDMFPIGATPLPLFFDSSADLLNNPAVQDIVRARNVVELLLKDPHKKIPGRLYMSFNTRPIKLRGWRVVDAQGQIITISVYNLQAGHQIDDAQFRLTFHKRPAHKR